MRRRIAVGIAAYLAALAAAAWIVASQPVDAPWWVYADADATYTGSALNVAAGEHTKYFDHPGLPLQEAGATGFVVWHAVTGSGSLHEFSGRMLLDLDRARPLYRGIAILLYFLGVTAAFLVAVRALGHPLWGLAGAILWLGAPLLQMSIQFRPDVLLSWLVLVGGYLAVRGHERRDPVRLAAAAALASFTLMVKLHAVGLLPALLLAVALTGPVPDWRDRLGVWLRVHRVALTVALCGWLALAGYFDVSRIPFRPSGPGVAILIAGATLTATLFLLGRPHRRVLSDFNGALVGALLLGVLVPVVVVLDDGLRSLPWVARALLGRGVNSGVGHFSDFGQFAHTPLREGLVVFLLAGAGALVGARRREWSSLIWFVAAVAMGVLALGRLGAQHYFAPAYALSIVPALRLAQRSRALAPVAGLALVLVVAVPQLRSVGAAEGTPPSATRTQAALDRTLPAHAVALTEPFVPLPDTRYFSLVTTYVSWTPAYPYRTLPINATSQWVMAQQGLRPRLYLSATPLAEGSTVGDYTVRGPARRIGEYQAYRVVSGPGVDRPLPPAPPPGAPLIAPP